MPVRLCDARMGKQEIAADRKKDTDNPQLHAAVKQAQNAGVPAPQVAKVAAQTVAAQPQPARPFSRPGSSPSAITSVPGWSASLVAPSA